MNYINLIIYILSIFLLGFAILSFCENRNSFKVVGLLELIAFSFVIGVGATGFLFFFQALFLQISKQLWIYVNLVIALLLIFLGKSFQFSDEIKKDFFKNLYKAILIKRTELFLYFPVIIVLLISFSIVFANIFFTPLWDIDSFALWGFKSKVIYLSGLNKDSYFHLVEYGFSHLDYPLLVPFVNAGIYISAGNLSQNLGKLLYLPLFLSFFVILYCSAKKKLNSLFAFALSAILCSTAPFIQWASAGTADIYLATFLLLSFYYALNFMETSSLCYLIGFSFANLFIAFTKNEGLIIALINFIILFIFESVRGRNLGRLSRIIMAGIVVFLLILPWLIWSMDIPKIHENYPAQIKNIFLLDRWKRIPEIVSAFFTHISNLSRWGVFWLIVLIGVVFPKRDLDYLFPLVIFFILALLYFIVFMISPWSVKYLNAAALERLLIHLSIPGFFVVLSFLKIFVNRESQLH